MKTIKKILEVYSCDQIWSRIFDWVQNTEKQDEITGYGNGFNRKGKAYLYDLIDYYPKYREEILSLF